MYNIDMNTRKQLSMKRLYQMCIDYFLTRTNEPVSTLQAESEIIRKFLDFVWKNKNK